MIARRGPAAYGHVGAAHFLRVETPDLRNAPRCALDKTAMQATTQSPFPALVTLVARDPGLSRMRTRADVENRLRTLAATNAADVDQVRTFLEERGFGALRNGWKRHLTRTRASSTHVGGQLHELNLRMAAERPEPLHETGRPESAKQSKPAFLLITPRGHGRGIVVSVVEAPNLSAAIGAAAARARAERDEALSLRSELYCWTLGIKRSGEGGNLYIYVDKTLEAIRSHPEARRALIADLTKFARQQGGAPASYLIEGATELGPIARPILEAAAQATPDSWWAEQARKGLAIIEDRGRLERYREHRATDKAVGNPYNFASSAAGRLASGDIAEGVRMLDMLARTIGPGGAPHSHAIAMIEGLPYHLRETARQILNKKYERFLD
jgi:hypothetical protein